MKKFVLLIISAIVFFSCEKEHDIIVPTEVSVEYNAFLQAASEQGIKINEKKFKGFILTGDITSVTATDGIHAAAYYCHKDKFIYIDTTSIPYRINREAMIFHELGHAILRREHKTGNFKTGEITSMMNANSLPNYATQFGYKRQYYIDELFNEKKSYIPYWSERACK